MMEINLLPKEPYVVGRFRFLLFVTVLLLLLTAAAALHFYTQTIEQTSNMQQDVLELKVQKQEMEQRLARNEEIRQLRKETAALRQYRLTANSLHASRVNWGGVLSLIGARLPENINVLYMKADGNRLDLVTNMNQLQTAAAFVEQVQRDPAVMEVRVNRMEAMEDPTFSQMTGASGDELNAKTWLEMGSGVGEDGTKMTYFSMVLKDVYYLSGE